MGPGALMQEAIVRVHEATACRSWRHVKCVLCEYCCGYCLKSPRMTSFQVTTEEMHGNGEEAYLSAIKLHVTGIVLISLHTMPLSTTK